MIELLQKAFAALQPLSNIGLHREREDIRESQVAFAREVVRELSEAICCDGDCNQGRDCPRRKDVRSRKVSADHAGLALASNTLGKEKGKMIEDANDPAGAITDIDVKILELKKLLRPATGKEYKAMIACCQIIKSNISSIEDWAFQKGKDDGRS